MGTIAQKSDYLIETKDKIKESINNLGGSITSSTTFREYAEELDTIYSNLPKVTGENTEVTLTPTLKGKLGIVEKGNSTQEGTPTPSSPIPIKSVTGNNNVVVRGKNLVQETQIGYWSNNGTWSGDVNFCSSKKIEVEVGKTYVGSMFDKQYNYVNKMVYVVFDNNGTFVRYTGDDTVTIASGEKYVSIRNYSAQAGYVTGDNYLLQLEVGSSHTSYQEYITPQTLPLNLGTIELNKIGTYQDYIYKNNDKWYKKEVIGKVVLNGSETWQLRNTSANGTKTYSLSSTVPEYYREENTISPNNMAYCDKFVINRTVLGASAMYTENVLLDVIGVSFYYNSENTSRALYINTKETLPTYFENNNAKFLYKRATATDIEITDTDLIAQLENIDKMLGYNGTTIITSTYDNNNAQMIISGSALKGE